MWKMASFFAQIYAAFPAVEPSFHKIKDGSEINFFGPKQHALIIGNPEATDSLFSWLLFLHHKYQLGSRSKSGQ